MSRQDSAPPSDQDREEAFEIDSSVAHAARRYNYLLGGTDNFEADRISGEAIVAAFPTVRVAVMENRRFLRRAVTYLVEEVGIRQFLDIGTGIPSADNVHEVAQAIDPKARVVYVDNDPIVLAHAHRLLSNTADGGTTVYIHADLREPDAILNHPDLTATLDLTKPVGLMLISVVPFLTDADDPYGKVARLAGALAPGSHLAMSHGTSDFRSPEAAAKFEAMIRRESARSREGGQNRDRAAFARFFAGMDVVPPGIVALPAWRSELPPARRPSAADVSFYCAVARIR
ncbi:MAG TPA: SAM-dependent methyltransferase [Streptosporangiaceae bacterium]|nr:SAM-dependent methyltransferase [Streptosporangiaceae bacterium]